MVNGVGAVNPNRDATHHLIMYQVGGAEEQAGALPRS